MQMRGYDRDRLGCHLGLRRAWRRCGVDADLVVLDSDPQDVAAFAHVRLTMRAGRTIYDAKAPAVN
jgi:hypothetical protein